MTETKYTVKVWFKTGGLKAMSILLNTNDDHMAVKMYDDLVRALRPIGYDCSLEATNKTTKEIHRTD
jgi:hypothetical protein